MKRKIFLSVLIISLVYHVSAFSYLSESRLCVINSLGNTTCLNNGDSYTMNNGSYYFSSYDKHYSLNYLDDTNRPSMDELLTKIGIFLLSVTIGFIIVKFGIFR